MSARRPYVEKRLTLFRTCGTCGKTVVTTADTPWVRQVPRDGKKMATTYYCSEGCYAASYKHIGWRYYTTHREERIEAARQRRRENPGLAAADNAYYRRKRKLMAEGAQV